MFGSMKAKGPKQKTQWPKENKQKDKQRSTKHTYKTKDRVTRTHLTPGGELRCSERLRQLLSEFIHYILESLRQSQYSPTCSFHRHLYLVYHIIVSGTCSRHEYSWNAAAHETIITCDENDELSIFPELCSGCIGKSNHAHLFNSFSSLEFMSVPVLA